MYFFAFIMVSTIINITQDNCLEFASSKNIESLENYPPCYFSVFTVSDDKFDNECIHNYSVLLWQKDEIFESKTLTNIPITHCRWLPGSAFKTAMPLKVNSKYIRYVNWSGQFSASQLITRRKHLCLCNTNVSYDFHKDLLDPLYPGKTMTLNIYKENLNIPAGFGASNNTIITVLNDTDWLPPTDCVVTNPSELLKTIKNGVCTTLNYTIAFPTQTWCELFFRGYYDRHEVIDAYYIEQLSCPTGFTKINGT